MERSRVRREREVPARVQACEWGLLGPRDQDSWCHLEHAILVLPQRFVYSQQDPKGTGAVG